MTRTQLFKLTQLFGQGYSRNWYADKLNFETLCAKSRLYRAMSTSDNQSPHNKIAYLKLAILADEIAESI